MECSRQRQFDRCGVLTQEVKSHHLVKGFSLDQGHDHQNYATHRLATRFRRVGRLSSFGERACQTSRAAGGIISGCSAFDGRLENEGAITDRCNFDEAHDLEGSEFPTAIGVAEEEAGRTGLGENSA